VSHAPHWLCRLLGHRICATGRVRWCKRCDFWRAEPSRHVALDSCRCVDGDFAIERATGDEHVRGWCLACAVREHALVLATCAEHGFATEDAHDFVRERLERLAAIEAHTRSLHVN